MKKIALMCLLLVGCSEEEVQPPTPIIPGQQVQTADKPMKVLRLGTSNNYSNAYDLIEVKSHGKTYLILYHDGSNAESMIKLDEFPDEEKKPLP